MKRNKIFSIIIIIIIYSYIIERLCTGGVLVYSINEVLKLLTTTQIRLIIRESNARCNYAERCKYYYYVTGDNLNKGGFSTRSLYTRHCFIT